MTTQDGTLLKCVKCGLSVARYSQNRHCRQCWGIVCAPKTRKRVVKRKKISKVYLRAIRKAREEYNKAADECRWDDVDRIALELMQLLIGSGFKVTKST